MFLPWISSSWTVHPHTYGELSHALFNGMIVSGSSPYIWGTPQPAQYLRRLRRFIPTYVGNSNHRPRSVSLCPVHPHIREELLSSMPMLFRLNGSSPHTWGTPLHPTARHVELRFIPTYVGNSTTSAGFVNRSPVHPHIRGELRFMCNQLVHVHGSSPHTWGTPGPMRTASTGNRFIPTYVGNSASACIHSSQSPVHPHIRGELQIQARIAQGVIGSSPHTWGTLILGLYVGIHCRFIPTYVGNSPRRARGGCCGTVHPHIRGELAHSCGGLNTQCDSSPHTWGTQVLPVAVDRVLRFIPTYVGNSVG